MPDDYEREPLVDLTPRNARPGPASRKSLPTKPWGSRDMDRNSKQGSVMSVTPKTDYYLDCDDYRGRN